MSSDKSLEYYFDTSAPFVSIFWRELSLLDIVFLKSITVGEIDLNSLTFDICMFFMKYVTDHEAKSCLVSIWSLSIC